MRLWMNYITQLNYTVHVIVICYSYSSTEKKYVRPAGTHVSSCPGSLLPEEVRTLNKTLHPHLPTPSSPTAAR